MILDFSARRKKQLEPVPQPEVVPVFNLLATHSSLTGALGAQLTDLVPNDKPPGPISYERILEMASLLEHLAFQMRAEVRLAQMPTPANQR